jgi:hypothetical protein
MMLRRIFGPKRDKLTGEWRRLHNILIIKYYSGGHIKNEMGGHVARMGRGRFIQGFERETGGKKIACKTLAQMGE